MSVSCAGAQGNGHSYLPSLSSDARYVAFVSYASNLVPMDTNAVRDIFVHDLVTGITERVSVDSAGLQGNGECEAASISADGRYIAFTSHASNLVPVDTNGVRDVFVHDRLMGTTERVSVDSAGVQGNGPSGEPPYISTWHSISADGRYVVFDSLASNLVLLDTNGSGDVFVHDRVTGATERVSVDSAGVEGDDYSGTPSISSDGRYVAFVSYATNLGGSGGAFVFVHDRVAGTTEAASSPVGCGGFLCGLFDPGISSDGRYVTYWTENGRVFVHDRGTGTTELVSDSSIGPTISANGRYVAFSARDDSNLVPVDTNDVTDIFVHDRATEITRRAMHFESNGNSYSPEISPDGRHLAFYSRASNLVSHDTNGTADIFVGKLSP